MKEREKDNAVVVLPTEAQEELDLAQEEAQANIEDKKEENSSDEKKHLPSFLKRIGESAAIKAKKAHDLDNYYYGENQ